ncbi:MAG TPA: UDP-N-acetylglucosamine 1-carboxyvinyltransferase [Candidatus Paceibacterota bacterium]|nr:UDP-N-acetylglucosamine 1-carboxyvinyltransferase [Candidatus Paceibacterota bacterium]
MADASFIIRGLGIGQGGKRTLRGEIAVGGAKNAALKVMAAAALFEDSVELANVPEIEDVNRMAELLEGTGMKIEKAAGRRKILLPRSPAKLDPDLPNGPAKAMRSSIVLTGPMLARMGRVTFPNPGGCSFGNRPIDLFLEGFKRFGAQIETVGEDYVVTAPGGLKGMEFFFKVQSHTGTETLMMAATLAKGRTVLKNCALEPEVKSLADYLNACGARISGAGTSTIVIDGGEPLSSRGRVYETMPDRIETGSFMILGALAGEKVVVKRCEPAHLEILTEILRTAGVRVELGAGEITVYGADSFVAGNVRTHEYPGLATDLQSPIAVLLTQSMGESALFETIYEGRLAYIKDLIGMGADIEVQDTHRVLVRGPKPLVGRTLRAPDLRAGFAFVIAAIIAKGESRIDNAYVIDRGYEKIVERLTKLGVDIKRG